MSCYSNKKSVTRKIQNAKSVSFSLKSMIKIDKLCLLIQDYTLKR